MKKFGFEKRKTVLSMLTVAACLSIVFLRVVWVRSNTLKSVTFFVAIAVVAAIYFAGTVILWRCPFCGKFLGKPDFGISVCKHCNKPLNKNDIRKNKGKKRKG